jgi:hypothetical protein
MGYDGAAARAGTVGIHEETRRVSDYVVINPGGNWPTRFGNLNDSELTHRVDE